MNSIRVNLYFIKMAGDEEIEFEEVELTGLIQKTNKVITATLN